MIEAVPLLLVLFAAPAAARSPASCWIEDCATLTFGPDEAAKSTTLESRPLRGGYGRGGGERCRDAYAAAKRRRATVRLSGREAMDPWEADRVTVCLAESALSVHPHEDAHEFEVVRIGDTGAFELVARRRLPSKPDPAGIQLNVWNDRAEGFFAAFTDKWSEHYAGAKTYLVLELRREKRGRDERLFRYAVGFDAAPNYKVDLSALAASAGEPLRAGETYYLKWGFRREGAGSSDVEIDRGRGESVTLR